MAERNLYECLPCPKCGSEFRACFRNPQRQDCDDCGFTEPWDDHQREVFEIEDTPEQKEIK